MIPGFFLIPPLNQIGPVSITYIGNSSSATSSTSINFASVPIGTAEEDRRVILAIHTRQSSVTAVTIGGIAATTHVASANTSFFDTTIVSALVPTGTTATVVITKNNPSSQTTIGVFRAVGGVVAPTSTASSLSTTPDTSSALTFSPTGQAGVAAISAENAPTTFTWSNATVSYEILSSGSFSFRYSAAIVSPSVSTVTATKSNAAEDAMAGAVWS